MAGNKVSKYSDISALASNDKIPTVDVSDTSQGAGGTTKYSTPAEMATFINDNPSGKQYLSTQFDKTNSAAMSGVTGLSIPLKAGGEYAISAALQVSAGASGGHKYRLDGTNGLTATSINYYVQAQTGTTAPTIGTRISDLGTTSAGVTSAFDGLTFITGGIVVNTAGDLIVRFAQNASDGTTCSVLVGSWIEAVRIG